jgi:hypothetical protein
MKKAFFDPQSRILVALGYCETNRPGDIALDVRDDFAATPGSVRLARDGRTIEAAAPSPIEQIVQLEVDNPISARGEREAWLQAFIAFGALPAAALDISRPLDPAVVATWPPMAQRLVQVEREIRALRAQL